MFDRTAFEGARRERFSALVVNAIQGLAADGVFAGFGKVVFTGTYLEDALVAAREFSERTGAVPPDVT